MTRFWAWAGADGAGTGADGAAWGASAGMDGACGVTAATVGDGAGMAGASGPLDDDDILAFPRGPEAGECLHALFERADFGDPASWPAAAVHALRLHPQPRADAAAALRSPRSKLAITPSMAGPMPASWMNAR